mmetsp:Transcript_51111/g.147464  ORF Transcript_51111/g.147464 Transcript_51111/m.147464 type:complete len:93 (+) Transcript_51111:660-938(+)
MATQRQQDAEKHDASHGDAMERHDAERHASKRNASGCHTSGRHWAGCGAAPGDRSGVGAAARNTPERPQRAVRVWRRTRQAHEALGLREVQR